MATPLRIVTGFWGDKYPPEYVEALKNQVRDCGYPLTVLGVDRPLQTGMKSWWPKLELFAPWNQELLPALFIDLDTFILDWNILIEIEENLELDRLWLINDFNRPHLGESGLFLAPNNEVSAGIWRSVERNKHNSFRGDGPFLNSFTHSRMNEHIDGILSYKVNMLQDTPDDARICCFHGKPKPHEAEGWAKNFWTTQISQWRKSEAYSHR